VDVTCESAFWICCFMASPVLYVGEVCTKLRKFNEDILAQVALVCMTDCSIRLL
jgi:hypothetical protein